MNLNIKELEQKINQARKDYYNGTSQVSDAVYDLWVDELSKLDPKNLAVIGIGSEPVSNWEKYKHLQEMGSLNKAQNQDEFISWRSKYAINDNLLLTLKLDGLSVSLIYENGVLVKGATRGSGDIGELITPNVAKMQGVPLRLPQKINATIRGEILLSKDNHQKYFQSYSNARNSASGVSRRYDGEGSDKLDVLVYQIISDDFDFKTYEDQFNTLQKLGFNVPTFYLLKTDQEVLSLKNQYEVSLRAQCDFDLDGLVIYNNNLYTHQQYGSLHGKPYCAIAYKFEPEIKKGSIADILIQVGNSGRLTPVAVFNPKVLLMGAEIERASLHNFSNIKQLGIGIGAEVMVCRSNDVIPFVKEIITKPQKIFDAPTHCPECNSDVIISGEYVQCPNVSGCPAQRSGRIKNWVKELNILELGDTLIEKLSENGLVNNVADLYTLTVEQLSELERMGKKSAQNVYNSLWANSDVPLEIFLGGLSIPMIGQSTIKAIMSAGCDTLEKFGQLSAVEFEQVPGVGPTKAKSLADGLAANQALILSILDNGVKIKARAVGNLSGKSLCFTGSMKNKRPVLEKMAADAGADVKGSVNKGLTYLVIADPNSTSSKAVAARKHGTTLISEEDFLDLVK